MSSGVVRRSQEKVTPFLKKANSEGDLWLSIDKNDTPPGKFSELHKNTGTSAEKANKESHFIGIGRACGYPCLFILEIVNPFPVR